jgi:hypothetical protein
VTLAITDSTTPINQVGTHAAPVGYGAAVTASFTHSDAGLIVTFDGPAGGGAGNCSYSWRLGNNTTSTQTAPVYTHPRLCRAKPGIGVNLASHFDFRKGRRA